MNAQQRIAAAYQWTMTHRPKAGAYPYLAEALRQAGVTKYVLSLPSGQTIYSVPEGAVAHQNEVLLQGMSEVPAFDQEAFVNVLRLTQRGECSFPEFLKGSWQAGIVRYEADLLKRQVTYFGAGGESYVEDFPAVTL